MTTDIQLIWREALQDIASPAALWQLAVILAALAIAWAINGAIKTYVLRAASQHHAPEDIKLAIGSFNRVLYPLSTLLFVWLGQLLLAEWHHTGLLSLACRLLLAMAVIRLIVYVVRYIFAPSGLLRTLESLVTWLVWGVLALHLSGVLPKITQVLADTQFTIGKNHVNLLIILQAILTVVVTLFAALWLSRMLENKLMRTEQMGMNMRVVLVKLIRIVLMFIAILMALSAVGLDITLLSVFGGALGVGLGFGLQKIASNYVSGFIILLDKSMNIGDIISVDKHYGVINDMRSRYMVLRKLDGTNVIIPNETLITSAVVNHSLHEHKGRVQVQVAINYASDVEFAMQTMRDVVKEESRVLKIPSPEVHIKGFGEFGIELALVIWVADPENGVLSLQSTLYLSIWKTFKQHQIEMAKPSNKTET